MKKQLYILTLFFTFVIQAQINKVSSVPINDEVSGAIDLTNGNSLTSYMVNGTNIEATTSVVPVSTCDELRRDTWFSVIIPASGNLTIETSQADSNSIYDTVMSIYSGSISSLTLVDCNDDLDGVSGFSRIVLSGRTESEKLYVSVWRFGDSTIGDFKVSAFDSSILVSPSFKFSTISLFPNPTTNALTFTNLNSDFDLEIYNLLGQKVVSSKILQSQPFFDVSKFKNGTYILQIKNETENVKLKFIKN